MKISKIKFLTISFVLIVFSSCKIKNVAGPYQPAPSKITINELSEEEESRNDVVPMPNSVVRKSDNNEEQLTEDLIVEPVQPKPIEVNPEPVENEIVITTVDTKTEINNNSEVEVKTRSEKFVVVEGQEKVELKTYHVVIGSFGNKNNALRLQAKMKPEYDPILVMNEKGMFRVLLISYDTYKEAKVKIQEIRPQFFDAWVLIQKKEVSNE